MAHSPKRGESAVFAEFHEFLSSPQKILKPQFQYLSLEKLLFFVAKIDFHFIFSELKIYMQKKVLFSQNFMSFYRTLQFFLGNIFKYVKKKSAIFAENMKNIGVCRFKKVRF
jgi:hypothetical protein